MEYDVLGAVNVSINHPDEGMFPFVLVRHDYYDELALMVLPQVCMIKDAETGEVIYSPSMFSREFLKESTIEYLESHQLWGSEHLTDSTAGLRLQLQ